MSESDRVPRLIRRLLLCLAVGVAMAGTVFFCAAENMRNAIGYRREHLQAFYAIRSLKTVLDERHKATGRFPEKLADLREAHPNDVRFDDSGQIPDPWGNFYQYQADGTGYTLFSLGRDGKRGGDGLDEDPDVRDLPGGESQSFQIPPVGIPTLRQFIFECPTRGVMNGAALPGAFAFVACLVTTQTKGQAVGWRSLLKLALTLVACFLTAIIMSAIHVPSNH